REQRRPVTRQPGVHHELVLIDQAQLRQRLRELHTSQEQSLAGSPLSCRTAFSRSPCTSSAFQSTRLRVLDTTYFFAASMVRAKGLVQSGIASHAGGRHASSIIW